MKTVLTLTAATALALSACGAAQPDICDRDHPLYERGSCDKGDGANATELADTTSEPVADPKPKVKDPKKPDDKVKKPKVKDPVKEPDPVVEETDEETEGEGTEGCGKRHCDPVPGDTTGEDILDDDDVIIGDDGFPRRRPNNGFGNGGGDGVPGKSPHGDGER